MTPKVGTIIPAFGALKAPKLQGLELRFLSVVMKLSALSPDASRHEAVIWWRNWMVLLTIGSFVMLLILLVMSSADWILLAVFTGVVVAFRQVIDLTRKARKLGR